MSVLLSLIEKDAAKPGKLLQDVGKQLLAIRTKVNSEITRMIMLRETTSTVRKGPDDDCDCGVVGEVFDGLDNVINKGEGEEEEGGEDAEGGGENTDDAVLPSLSQPADADSPVTLDCNDFPTFSTSPL
jgi:hypothetical protein